MEDHIVTTSVTIKATPAEVWQAIIDPAMVKQYLFGTTVESTWEVGSPITYSGEWEGKAYQDKGTVLEIEPEKKLVTSYWSTAFGPESPENYKKVTYELSSDGETTTLTLTQDNNKDEATKEHSEANWKMVLDGMKKLLEE